MTTAALFQPISVRDYLSGERQAKHKHEYVYLGLDAIIPLPEIACNFILAELYENVVFSTPDQIREQEDGYEN